MDYSEFRKQKVNHYRCAVCGKSFGARFNDDLGNFPIFHPVSSEDNIFESCEHRFFKTILRIYLYLHEMHCSSTMNSLLNDFDWLGHILMKKEFVSWTLKQGYLTLDNLSRIKIPDEIEDSCKDTFTRDCLKDPKKLEIALDMLKAAYRCYQDQLRKTEMKDMILDENAETEGEECSLGHNRFMVKEASEKTKQQLRRMHTIEHTGAEFYNEKRQRFR